MTALTTRTAESTSGPSDAASARGGETRPGTGTLRSPGQLVADQLRGIAAWHAATAEEEAVPLGVLTREMRLDLARRVQARQRERAALLGRAAQQLEQSGRLRPALERPRAVVVHRDGWLRGKLALALQEHGLDVVASLEDGADAAGVVVVEQPEVLFVEDRLPTLTGLQVLQRAREFAPGTLIGVQLADLSERARYCGADVVLPRRLRPAELGAELVAAFSTSGPLLQVS